jgi:ribosomal subunit interface protein
MPFPLQVHFIDLPPSDAVAAKIRKKFEGLERYSNRILACHVWVEKPLGHHRKGLLYEVQARLVLPGEEIVVVAQPPEEDVYVAVRNTYDALRRKIEDHERRQRGRVQAHPRRKARTEQAEIPRERSNDAANA